MSLLPAWLIPMLAASLVHLTASQQHCINVQVQCWVKEGRKECGSDVWLESISNWQRGRGALLIPSPQFYVILRNVAPNGSPSASSSSPAPPFPFAVPLLICAFITPSRQSWLIFSRLSRLILFFINADCRLLPHCTSSSPLAAQFRPFAAGQPANLHQPSSQPQPKWKYLTQKHSQKPETAHPDTSSSWLCRIAAALSFSF